MPFLTTSSADLHYEQAGDGPPLMLIAGLASDHASWGPIIEPLASRFTLIMPDNRGSGQTRSKGPIAVNDWVADLVTLSDHLQLDRFGVIGHSLGGQLAYRLAAVIPDRIDALVTMCAPNGNLAKPHVLLRDLRQARRDGMSEEMFYRLFFQFLFAPEFFQDNERVEQAVSASLEYEHRQSQDDFDRQVDAVMELEALDLSGMDVPTLAITAECDALFPPRDLEETLFDHPMLTTLMIENAGHSVHWDQPKMVVGAIQSYMMD